MYYIKVHTNYFVLCYFVFNVTGQPLRVFSYYFYNIREASLGYELLVGVVEKAMAPHSSTLARKIPWMEEPGRLQSMRSLGVGHD